MTTPSPVDFADIQGLVRFGYGALTEASFVLLEIRDPSTARAWLDSAPVSTGVELAQAPDTALQIAFTCEGLRALGIGEDILTGFSAEFYSGMAGDKNRSRRLGDVGANSPQYWEWGGSSKNPHLVVMIYAREGQLEAWSQTIRGADWESAFSVLDCLPTSNLFGVEPFGFTDGISQPTIDWKRQRQPKEDQIAYGNLVALGEFLLGYPNEYGKYTDRPLIATNDEKSVLLFAEDKPALYDLGRNGTYLVLRQLTQDVRGFWQFLDRQANSDPQTRQTLAEAFVGRKQNGKPLVDLSKEPIEGIDKKDAIQNQFTFDSDTNGLRCPLGAHIRRANPRTTDLPGASDNVFSKLKHTLGFGEGSYGQDVIASTRFHRLLRRGREYGPGLSVADALQPAPPDDANRGIHFISLGANISRQFEFVQSAWVMSSKFAGLTGESDPLLGNREPILPCGGTSAFSLTQENTAKRQIMALPQFITVRGGAYFFLPGIRALRFLVKAGSI
ncbi:peroxidase [Alloacidobacterium dinghuense]|uniref:Peroxidase n=1 Tax=Alloacidobacterium dinghuense TaxID=2763107 RepID=A0A7G8BCC0_9BACT|nr:peroxidase [Alloacidobacterium dinghuense]QNI30190.1 peroxidase [Alloacidobacterium dinghuense]